MLVHRDVISNPAPKSTSYLSRVIFYLLVYYTEGGAGTYSIKDSALQSQPPVQCYNYYRVTFPWLPGGR